MSFPILKWSLLCPKSAGSVFWPLHSQLTRTDKPFGANLHLMNLLTPKFAEVLVEEGLPAVTLSGGSPKQIIPILHEHGIKAIVVIPSVELARKAADIGADIIVAEGSESGGM